MFVCLRLIVINSYLDRGRGNHYISASDEFPRLFIRRTQIVSESSRVEFNRGGYDDLITLLVVYPGQSLQGYWPCGRGENNWNLPERKIISESCCNFVGRCKRVVS